MIKNWKTGLVCFVVGFILSFTATKALASPETCMRGAQFVESVGFMRDNGVPKDQVDQQIKESFDGDEEAFFLKVAEVVYNYQHVSPTALASSFYIDCRRFTDVDTSGPN